MARWTHFDQGLEASAQSAIARALAKDWTSAGAARDLRTLAAFTASVVGRLQKTPVISANGTQTVDLSQGQFLSPAGSTLAKALLSSFLVMSSTPGTGEPRFWTQGDFETSKSGQDAGTLAVYAVIAVCAAVGLAAMAWVAHEAAPVVDRALARQAAWHELMATHAELLKLADQHAKREEAAKAAVPLNAAESAAIDALLKAQGIVLAKIKDEKPYSSPPLFQAGDVGLMVGAVLLGLWIIGGK